MDKGNADYYDWVDFLKGVGILLMVIGHASAPYLIKKWIYGFHMPLFFVLAGYTFNLEKWKNNGFSKLVINRAKAYLKPYIVLFIFGFLAQTVFDIISGRSSGTVRYILAGLYSFDIDLPQCAPIWFLTCLFLAYMFFWILVNQTTVFRQVILGIIYLLVLVALKNLENMFDIIELPWHIDTALVASVFMLLGYTIKASKHKFDSFVVSDE